MKIPTSVLIALILAGEASAEVAIHWWGQVSFRQRHEIDRWYFKEPTSAKWGELWYTEENSRTRLGYQIGVKADVRDSLSVGLTLRSGLRSGGKGSVMWQDIDDITGLMPTLQEAYLDWRTPYAGIQAGKYPQAGNAMWDLYAAPLWNDFRQDDPTDGVFSDRIASLSGAKITVPVGPAELRGIYHTDYVGGSRKEWPDTSQEDEVVMLDRKVFLVGGEVSLGGLVEPCLPTLMSGFKLKLDGDWGFPYRDGDMSRGGKDSAYAREKLWGATLKTGLPGLELQAGYAYNWRDSTFKSEFTDLMLWGEYAGFRLTGRCQHNIQEYQFGPYKDHQADRQAYHIYLNKQVWNLDLQPRYIWFITEIDGRKAKTTARFELTATARF